MPARRPAQARTGAEAPLPQAPASRGRLIARACCGPRQPGASWLRPFFALVRADAARLPLADGERRSGVQQFHAALVRPRRRCSRNFAACSRRAVFLTFTSLGPDTLKELRSRLGGGGRAHPRAANSSTCTTSAMRWCAPASPRRCSTWSATRCEYTDVRALDGRSQGHRRAQRRRGPARRGSPARANSPPCRPPMRPTAAAAACPLPAKSFSAQAWAPGPRHGRSLERQASALESLREQLAAQIDSGVNQRRPPA